MRAIVAALPREVAELVRGVVPDAGLRPEGIYIYRMPRAVVACAGMGALRVNLAVQAAVAAGGVEELVSVGLAGACDPSVPAGDVVEAGTLIDALSGERYQAGSGAATLVTTHAIASVREKARLFASYGAAIVDMEAATVARLAKMHGLGFRAIKGVSDTHDFELSSLGRFASPHGHFRTGAFALHTVVRPHTWRHAMRLGAGSQKALRALTARLKEMVG